MLTAIGLIIISITAALCTRLLILAIIDITSFRGMTVEYLSPLYPMALLCISLIIFDTLHGCSPKRDSQAKNLNPSRFPND